MPDCFNSSTRAAQKEASRAQDEEDIRSGRRTKEQVQKDNSFIKAEWGLRIDLATAPVAG